jgi:L-asparagine transporter-like permease
MSFFFGFALIVSTAGVAAPLTVVAAAVAIALLFQHSGSINLKPFDPGNLHRGFSGLSLGFPLAVYLFIGWENSAAMAEESQNPRTGVLKPARGTPNTGVCPRCGTVVCGAPMPWRHERLRSSSRDGSVLTTRSPSRS